MFLRYLHQKSPEIIKLGIEMAKYVAWYSIPIDSIPFQQYFFQENHFLFEMYSYGFWPALLVG